MWRWALRPPVAAAPPAAHGVAPPVSPPPAPPAQPAPPAAVPQPADADARFAAHVRRLQMMKTMGALNEAEYNAERQKLLAASFAGQI